MASTTINLNAVLNFDDSNFKKGIKSVDQSLKKYSTTPAFIKLKLDDSDWRKQFQELFRESNKEIEKYNALSYKTAGGKTKKADSSATMQSAYTYHLTQSTNEKLSRAEQNAHNRAAEALKHRLNLLYEFGKESRRQAIEQAQIAAMPARLAQAQRSGLVEATRRKAAKENAALEKQVQLKKEIAAIDERLDANAASNNSEKEKLEEELSLLKMKAKYLREQDKIAGIPEGSPSALLAETKERIKQVEALQRLNTIYTTQNNILTKLRNIAGQYFSVQGIMQFGQKVAEVTGFFEKQQIALEGILGSATKAQQAILQIQQMALTSPFQAKDLLAYTKQLAAFGVESEELLPSMSKLADIATGLGVDMSRIILAYGQVKSATVLRGQELRQFTEAGIPMVEELAKKFTKLNGELVTTADIFEMISKRQVSFEMVSSVMSDLTAEGGKFYKMQEKITESLAGQIEKLKDIWTNKLNEIGQEHNSVFTGIVKMLQTVAKNTKSVAFAMMAMIPTSYILREIARMKMEFAKLNAAAQKAAGGWLKHGLKTGALLKGLGGAISTIGLGVAVGLIVNAIEKSRELENALKNVSKSFEKETNQMIEGVNSLFSKLKSAKAGSDAWNSAIETLKTNYGEFVNINDELIQGLNSEVNITKELREEYTKLNETIAAAIRLKQQYEQIKTEKEVVEGGIIKDIADDIEHDLKKGTLVNYDLFGTSVGKLGDKLNTIFGTKYSFEAGDNSINRLGDRIMSVVNSTMEEFLRNGFTTEDDFMKIYKKHLESEFVLGDFDGTYFEKIFASKVYNKMINAKGYDKYSEKVTKLQGDENSMLGYLIKIRKAFEELPELNGTNLEKYEQRQKFYGDLLRKQKGGEEGAYSIQSIIEDLVAAEDLSTGTNAASKAFEKFNAILNNGTDSAREISNAFNEFYDAFGSGERRSLIEEIGKLYEENTEALTADEEALADRLDSLSLFKDKVVKVDGKDKNMQDYLEKWNPVALGKQTIEQTREQLKTEYDSLKKQKESYAKEGSGSLFEDDIAYIDAKMKVLEEIAKKQYYDVDLTDDKKGGAKQLPPELADFLSSLKNAYQRYNESVDKGGIGIGLNYVRTNEMFQEMFGEFFGGAEGEKFNALSGMKVGSHTVGELLSGKFLEGLEEGVIDFKAAALALAEDLESTNIKSYKQAGKQLRQWVDSTISKDSLNATMNELEKTIKDLTNSFEKANKEVDLYRKLQENGTAKALGGQIGINAAMATTPDSVRMQGQIQTLLASLNEQLAAQSIAPLSLGSLSRIDEVYNAIENLGKITMMNNKAFDGTALGKIGDNVNNLLKQLLETLIKEAESISGEVYSGSAMNDLIANATKRLQSGQFALTSKENIARNLGTYDMAAIKTFVNATQEDAKKIFDQFMSDNRLDVIAREGNGKISDKTLEDLEDKLKNISKDFPDALRDELLSRLKDLRNKVGEYNASIGAWGSFGGAIRGYRNANENAKREYDLEVVNNDQIKARIEAAKLLGLSVDELNAELALSNERLKEMGENGEKLAEDFRKLSLANMQKSIQQCQEQFSSMVNSVNAVVDAAKAFANTINKVYDVMNDGENPAWMQDMESFLGDFGDAFGAMIAPMMSIISLVSTLTVAFVACEAAMTPLLIVMGVLIAVAAIVAGIVAAVQQHDRSLQRTIENLEKQIKDTQTAMGNLDAAAERMVGIDKFKKQLESLSQNMKMYHDALKQAELEEAKKNTDEDKLKEYKQNAQEFIDEFKNGLRGMFEEITGSVDELADAISSAMRSAFQSGENAARNMAAVVKENIGNIVEEIMKMNYLKPAIETAMNALRGGSEDWFEEQFTDKEGNFDYESALDYFLGRLQNDENVENFEDMMNSISTGYIDLYNSLSDTMKEYFSFSSDNSALSGGISGITEDTARTLEGLANSMLMQMILTNRELNTISQSGFAQVQVSWFNDMLQQARATRIATENLNNAIAEMRNGVRPMSVTIS